jgi:DNA adenine methylase
MGGKGCFRRHLLPLLPEHTAYIEPFGGGASVLLAKAPCATETYNDVDRGLYEFFQVVSNPMLFPHFLVRVSSLPYSRELYDECRDTWHGCRDQMERVWRWFVVARQSFGGCFDASWGTCVKPCNDDRSETCASWQSIMRVLPAIHARLQRVQIECCDGVDCLKRYDGPGYLAYCDPPYVWRTRKSGRYTHEMSDDQHQALVTTLLQYRGAVILSGYASELYKPLEDAGWNRLDIETKCSVGGRTKHTCCRLASMKRVESIWRNPEALRRPLNR